MNRVVQVHLAQSAIGRIRVIEMVLLLRRSPICRTAALPKAGRLQIVDTPTQRTAGRLETCAAAQRRSIATIDLPTSNRFMGSACDV
jgi:hypothetical protein